MTTVTLRKVNRKGNHFYVWTDPNGHEWRVYQSFGHYWRYIRDDHDVSSIGYLTMEDARAALEKAFIAD